MSIDRLPHAPDENTHFNQAAFQLYTWLAPAGAPKWHELNPRQRGLVRSALLEAATSIDVRELWGGPEFTMRDDAQKASA